MMIDERHIQGDSFAYDGELVFEGEDFSPNLLEVTAAVSKSHGGVDLDDLVVDVGAEVRRDGVVFVPVSISATPEVTESWPQGPVTMTVVVSYDGFRQTCRPVKLSVEGRA